jgi:hypothetical protein
MTMARTLLAVLVLTVGLLGAAPVSAGDGDNDYEADYTGLLAPGGYVVLYYNSAGPLSYHVSSLRDLPPGAIQTGRVRSTGCQYGISVPLSLSANAINVSAVQGDGSYARILRQMQAEHPELAGLFDVIVDAHTIQVFGIFRRLCTEVTARGFALPAGAAR